MSDLEHCSSSHGESVVLVPENRAFDERTVQVCVNRETLGEVHYIVMGVDRNCVDDFQRLKFGVRSQLKNFQIKPGEKVMSRLYDSWCPMFRGEGRVAPVMLSERIHTEPGITDIVRTVLSDAYNVLVFNSDTETLTVDLILYH